MSQAVDTVYMYHCNFCHKNAQKRTRQMPPPRASTASLTQYITFFRLCVVLFTKQGQHEKEKLALRLLATDKKYLSEKRLKFFYAHEDVQRDLVEEFKDGRKDDRCAENSTASKVNY